MVALNSYPKPSIRRVLQTVGVRRALRIAIVCFLVLAAAESQADACSCPFFAPCQRWFGDKRVRRHRHSHRGRRRSSTRRASLAAADTSSKSNFPSRGRTSKTLEIIGGTSTEGCAAVFDKGETYIVYGVERPGPAHQWLLFRQPPAALC